MKKRIRKWKLASILIGLSFIIMIFVLPAKASEPFEQQLLVDKARIIFDSFMADQNMEWFRENKKLAKGLLIIPELLKGGFFWVVQGGRGCSLSEMKNQAFGVNPLFTQ